MNPNDFQNITRAALDREMLEFTLSLYNNPLFSRKAVDGVFKMFDNFISNLFVPFIQTQVETQLKSKLDPESYATTQFILEDSKSLFGKYSSEHLRFKQYEGEGLYVPPERFEIGKETVFVIVDYTTIEISQPKPVYGAHVSLKKTFERFFAIPGVFEGMQAHVATLSQDNTTLSNVVQGDLWKENYKSRDKIVFPLFLFFDEFETRNALGTHNGEQKLGGTYASLPCLPPHLSAKLENVFVSSIFHAKYLKVFGNEKLFRKTIEDLNVLSSEGIMVNIKGKDQKIYFQCTMVLGDNLGLNCIGGFSRSFSARRFCRICTATSLQCKVMTAETESFVRTVESYNSHVEQGTLDSIGIKEPCVFNKIHNFHICANFSVDIMHDIYEGIASYTIGNILERLLKDKVIGDLKIINDRIQSFPLNQVEKQNKPRILFFTRGKKGGKKLKMKQSAAEMLCLTRYLGLMIGDLIPIDNECWELYLCLRKIIGILTSPSLYRSQIFEVQRLIQKHNYLYQSLFGALKPKMHFWLHYARIMLLFGPLVHFSSMMFERKNRKLKEVANGTTSNINLPLTIAIRHQLQLSYTTEFVSAIQSDVLLGHVDNEHAQSFLRKFVPEIVEGVSVQTLKSVEILGKRFSPGTVLVTRFTDEFPQFALLKKIFYANTVYFQVNEFHTTIFDHYYHAYSVHNRKDKKDRLINIELIPRLPPCLLVEIEGEQLIANRYDL